MFQIETVVYYDESYPPVWIERQHSFRIATYFTQNNVKYVDADELQKFMSIAVEKNVAHKKLVVFSQDMVPDTICECQSSDVLFREFLDQGGNVVWIGDIPLFYIGTKGAKDAQQCIQSWRRVAPTNILGIVTTSVSTLRSVKISHRGKTLGLHHHWTSARPVLKDKTMTVLAVSDNIGTDYHINVPKSPSLLTRLKRKIKVESVEFQGIKVTRGADDAAEPLTRMTPLRPERREQYLKSTLYEAHPAAWIKNFNCDFPCAGFARLWDYRPRVLSQSMIEELFMFTKNFAESVRWRNILRV